ncbi:6-phospho-beta-glucosidase [Paenibacillus frigoriresistens]|uniref:6-phospho-beta-glucosidase n=1 Tax=Paenibacillus alginolyticus TaxID=59839 RepID=UPI001567752A|nr:6-phospho-beta-glucosidase [Paenibacillus frigoriresistens]NRF94505.1 6-phospho-beta-glucosidase [Paenibacillus frigoriresistens]
MKLTILGGAGMRTALLVNGLVRHSEELHFDEIALFDADEERLKVMGRLSQYIAELNQASFRVTFTTDVREALQGADFVFSAVRVGQEESRVNDERVALKYGVLGQETTGPGGFAMALRTIPVMLEYTRIINEVAPNAWLLNFSNPSGLLAQAMNTYGHCKVIGICDAHAGIKNALSKFLGVHFSRLQVDYYGLNHLGWVPRVYKDGVDQMPMLLDRFEELAKDAHIFSFFDPELIRNIGMLPNEYLYYFYYHDLAVRNILEAKETRGEQIVKLNRPLLERITPLVREGKLAEAWKDYNETLDKRSSTYMSKETSGQLHNVHEHEAPAHSQFEEEGYEGLAINVMKGIHLNKQQILTLNVPNRGTIAGLHDDDVVEVPCVVNANGPSPLTVGKISDLAMSLIQPVKTYERLTVEAAVKGDYQAALNALTVHPMVPSFTVAKSILDEYIQVHKAYLPQFQ